MPPREPRERIRNIGIMAHVDAGKTTCTERVLYTTGRIHRRGEVHEGTATTDFLPDEIKRGITISAAAVTTSWRADGEDFAIRLIDTPGHVDFAIEVERSLRVLDGAVFVLDASAGVECQSESVWQKAERHGVARLTFVNKMDKVGASFQSCLASMRERLGARPLALQLPLGEEGAFRGMIDLVTMRGIVWDCESICDVPIPSELAASANEARRALIEAAAEHSDVVFEAWVRGEPPSERELVSAIRRGVLAGALHPVVCGSAYKNRGIEPLLDAVARYLPAPAERELDPGIAGDSLAALIFKTVSDARGTLVLLRLFSGVLRRGDAVVVAGERQRVGRLFVVHASERQEIESAQAGDIVAVMGLKGVRTGQTVCAPERPVLLESITIPEPVLEVSLEPRTRGDRERLGEALAALVADDPSLRIRIDEESGETVLGAMGQLHVEIVESNLEAAGVAVRVSAPKVAYRDTLASSARVDYKHVKQGGGPGQYARVVLEIEPRERGAGLSFSDETRGGVIPSGFVVGVEKGVRAYVVRGARQGFPLVDLAVRLVDGDTHVSDSSALAFEIAASLALREGVARAGLRLLEPIMSVEVSVPEASVGAVVGDLSSRRGTVREIVARSALHVVRAAVPLAKLFGYVGDLRSLTSGRGSVAMKPEGYEVVPERELARVLR